MIAQVKREKPSYCFDTYIQSTESYIIKSREKIGNKEDIKKSLRYGCNQSHGRLFLPTHTTENKYENSFADGDHSRKRISNSMKDAWRDSMGDEAMAKAPTRLDGQRNGRDTDGSLGNTLGEAH